MVRDVDNLHRDSQKQLVECVCLCLQRIRRVVVVVLIGTQI
jgi:hypothetical protein